MAAANRPQTRLVTIVFWVLLCYIIAALVWWLLSLERQNKEIYDLKIWASAPLIGGHPGRLDTGVSCNNRAIADGKQGFFGGSGGQPRCVHSCGRRVRRRRSEAVFAGG